MPKVKVAKKPIKDEIKTQKVKKEVKERAPKATPIGAFNKGYISAIVKDSHPRNPYKKDNPNWDAWNRGRQQGFINREAFCKDIHRSSFRRSEDVAL